MRIDTHTHVFTLHTILSREAIRVFEERLERKMIGFGFPEDVARTLAGAVGRLLHDQLNRPEYLDERRLLKKLLEKLTGMDTFNRLLTTHFADDRIKVQVEGDLDALAVDALRQILEAVLGADAGPVDKVADVIDTLRLSMQPTITHVVDDHLRDMDPDGVLVGLMMDIYKGPEGAEDHRRYLAQIDGHAEAALQRPGRVLPFFGVHPDRPGVLDRLKDAVENKGFVGVKLYPSLSPVDASNPLGSPVNSERMKKVYEYCVQEQLPVLLHCGHGGFYRTDEAREHCNPKFWEPIIGPHGAFPDLRVCFAHFGGVESLSKGQCFQAASDENWGGRIMEFMENNDNVYTDLAKHVDMFDSPDESAYFDAIEQVNDRVGRKCVLFGTDAWLLRLDMPYDQYWRKWRDACVQRGVWDAITIDGPREFLGFHGVDRAAWTRNLQRFVEHLLAHRHAVGRAPAAWVADVVDEAFVPDRDPPHWNRHRVAVRDTYQFLGRHLTESRKQAGFVNNWGVRLNELTYFDPGDPNFAADCRDMARRFVDFADQDMDYRPGHDFGSAVEHFVGIFRAGDMRLCDVALSLDSIIAYPETIS